MVTSITIHEDLLPDGVTVDEVLMAITVADDRAVLLDLKVILQDIEHSANDLRDKCAERGLGDLAFEALSIAGAAGAALNPSTRPGLAQRIAEGPTHD